MYVIADFIYGIPLSDEIIEQLEQKCDPCDPDQYFTTMYSGWGDGMPGYLGVCIHTFEQYQNVLDASEFIKKVRDSETFHDEFEAKYNELPDTVKDILKDITPDFYMVSYSS